MKFLAVLLLLSFQTERGTIEIHIRDTHHRSVKGTLQIENRTHSTQGIIRIEANYGLYYFTFTNECNVVVKGRFNLKRKTQALIIYTDSCSDL